MSSHLTDSPKPLTFQLQILTLLFIIDTFYTTGGSGHSGNRPKLYIIQAASTLLGGSRESSTEKRLVAMSPVSRRRTHH
jgi:hypothetical protein